MRISHQSPELLIIDVRPWLISILLSLFVLIFTGAGVAALFSGEMIGLAFVIGGLGVGGVLLFGFVQRVQVILDRRKGLVDMRRKTFRGLTRETFDLNKLERADVGKSRTSDGDTYRVVLRFVPGHSPGELPITGYYSSGRARKDTVAGAINRFLDAGRPTDARGARLEMLDSSATSR